MIKCKNCNKEIPTGSIYCLHCGMVQGKPEDICQNTNKLFLEIAEEWWKYHSQTLAPNTLKGYSPAYKRSVEMFGETPIDQITMQDVNTFIFHFVKQGYGEKTVKNQLMMLNLIFKEALFLGYIDKNPAEYVRLPKSLPKSHREAASDHDIKLVNSNIHLDFGLFPFLLLYTGCRRGEALALQYKDILRERNAISISKSVYHVKNVPYIKSPKSDAGTRLVPLLKPLEKVLPQGNPDDYIFPDPKTGGLMRETAFFKLWKVYCEKSGISSTPHQLRHSYATILFEAGIDEKDAQEFMGHSCISMTKDIYTHIRQSRRELSADKINQYLSSDQFNYL